VDPYAEHLCRPDWRVKSMRWVCLFVPTTIWATPGVYQQTGQWGELLDNYPPWQELMRLEG
jgi:hypothetical protein